MQNLPDEELRKASFGSRVYHGVLNALGGAQDVALTGYDPKTGAPIYSSAHQGPGQQWKKIISGALTGLAAAGSAGPGPGGAMRGFGAGFKASHDENIRQQEQQQKQAQQTFENQRQAMNDAANRSMLATQQAQLVYSMKDQKIQATERNREFDNQWKEKMREGGPGTIDMGHFPDDASVRAAFAKLPQMHDWHAGGVLLTKPHIEGDEIKGLDAAYVTPDWLHDTNKEPVQLTHSYWQDGEEKSETRTVPPGGITNEKWWSFGTIEQNAAIKQQKQTLDNQYRTDRLHQQDILTQAKSAEAWAAARRNDSAVAMNQAKADKLKDSDFGEGGEKGFETWFQKNVTPAQDSERSFVLADQLYRQYKALAEQGQEFNSGAPSAMLFAQHLATTMGGVKGMRFNKDIIASHLHARSVSDEMETAVNKFINGDMLSASQWDAFHELIKDSRDTQWQKVLDQADALGKPTNYIPFPPDFRRDNNLGEGRLEQVREARMKGNPIPDQPITNAARTAAGGEPAIEAPLASARPSSVSGPGATPKPMPPLPSRSSAPAGAAGLRFDMANNKYVWVDKANKDLPNQ